MKLNKYWFKPKSFGYGATPITWEGWTVVIIFVEYLFSLSKLLNESKITSYVIRLILGVIVIIIISKKKTEGDWKWG